MNSIIELLQKNTFDWLPAHKVRESLRVKRLQMRFSNISGFEIILPLRISHHKVIEFIHQKRSWIEKQYPKILSFQQHQKSGELPVELSLLAICEHWAIKYQEINDYKRVLIVHPDQNLFIIGKSHNKKIRRLLIQWLKKKAYQVFSELLPSISAETGLPYKRLNIKCYKTLWGSCTTDKTINLSICLLFLPPHLMKYVLIHELCHTIYLNHSHQFWHLVSIFDKNYKIHARETRKAMHYVPQWVFRLQ
jgi:hypothetical protein